MTTIAATQEQTIAMFNSLNFKEQSNVRNYIEKFFTKRKTETAEAMRPITKEEFLCAIDKSRKLADEGCVYTLDQVEEEMSKRYGF